MEGKEKNPKTPKDFTDVCHQFVPFKVFEIELAPANTVKIKLIF